MEKSLSMDTLALDDSECVLYAKAVKRVRKKLSEENDNRAGRWGVWNGNDEVLIAYHEGSMSELSAYFAWAVPARELVGVFLSLAAIIAASSGIFWLLVRRWTTQRHW